MNSAAMWIATGPRQVGKSAFCRGVVEAARQSGWVVTGLLTPAVFEHGYKTGFLVEDISTGETRMLASITRHGEDDMVLGDWYFDRHGIEWGNQILSYSLPSDLFVVDELGPLEFTYKTGWQIALEILLHRKYNLALVVIRPELLAVVRRLYDFSNIIEIDQTLTTQTQVRNFWFKMIGFRTDL
jgi:nucleoside-triphosphatase THEP1